MSKTSKRHPYAAIDHRVIESPAYADLSFSGCALLILLARQLTMPNNNGHLKAAFDWCKQRGFGSEHTLQGAIADLIAHGFIYRTKSHGANKVCARYAVTWLPISDKTDLFLSGFKPCAWRDWEPSNKKSTPQKVQGLLAESAVSPSDFLHKVQEVGGQKVQVLNCVPIPNALAAPLPSAVRGYIRINKDGIGTRRIVTVVSRPTVWPWPAKCQPIDRPRKKDPHAPNAVESQPASWEVQDP